MTINSPKTSKTDGKGGGGKRHHRNRPSKTQHKINTEANPNAGGIDIGATEIVVAVPPGRCEDNVRTFTSFTGGLIELRDWLLAHGVTTVAMESTGNYWVNCYDLIAEAGIEVCLVNARHVKGVPGKKTDVCDAQWLQQLHTAGLLKKSFRPAQDVLRLRYLVRHRDSLVRENASHLHRIQKVLTEMNLKLHHVFSDIDGVSGRAIIKAILSGERDPKVLAALRDGRCRSDEADVLAALEGSYRSEHLFVLGQLQTQWDEIRRHLANLDGEIAGLVGGIGPAAAAAAQTGGGTPRPRGKRKQTGKNAIALDFRKEGFRYYGVDLLEIDGVGSGVLTALMSEIGPRDNLLGSFASADHFCAWLGLCPCNQISGGKVLRSGTRKTRNRLAEALRLAAFGLEKAKCRMGEYCRRMKGRLGKAEGITATAHKLARVTYAMIASGRAYDEAAAFRSNPGVAQKNLKTLKILAGKLGFQLVPNQFVTMS
jgi:transposase